MTSHVVAIDPAQRYTKVILPDGAGVIEIQAGLRIGETPRVRVTVTSGPASTVRNHLTQDGVVYVDGWPEPVVSRETECRNGSPTCTPEDPCVVCYDREESGREGLMNVCDDGCGKYINHKVDGDPECGPR